MADYEIRVTGRLGPALLTEFPGLSAVVRPVETILVGPVADQAALTGLIDRLASLGVELVEVRRMAR